MENNTLQNKFHWLYLTGFFVILCLPLVALPPYFFQPDWAKAIIFRSIVAIMLFALFVQFLSKNNIKERLQTAIATFRKNPILWALGALFLVFLLASIFSVDPLFSFWGSPYRGGGFVTFAFLFAFAIIAFWILKKEDWKKAFIICISVGVLVSLIALIQFYGISNPIFSNISRPSATLGNPITLGIYLSILFFICLSFLISEKNKAWKIFYGLSLIIFIHAILITASRAAFLGVILGIILFFLSFSKGNKYLKISLIAFLILATGFLAYVNLIGKFPDFLEQNKVFSSVKPRLNIAKMFGDERFKAWQTFGMAIKDRPILGWGPENQSIAFDKFYDPNVTVSQWWDRAHNVFLDIAVQAGILGLLAYIFLFFALFRTLYKLKHNSQDNSEKIVITGLQSALLAYIVANLFSLDSMPSYILFFFIIAYTLKMSLPKAEERNAFIEKNNRVFKKIITVFAFCALVIFLWQYNYVPFVENGKMNFAEALTKNKRCDEAFQIMDNIASKKSFLDAYTAIQYVDLTITCNNFYPEKNSEYIKNGFEIVKKAVEKRPTYTRFWLSLGSYSNSLAEREIDSAKKLDLLNQAEFYFNEAEKFGPNHEEVLAGKIRTQLIAKDYHKMHNTAEKCIALDNELGFCHFYLGIAKIYLGDSKEGKRGIDNAESKGFATKGKSALNLQADAFEAMKDYKNLAEVYKNYVNLDYNNAQYHSSLAFVYSLLGEYQKAREEAMIAFKLAPDAKEAVNEFLKTLPY
jgi:O-antigen ligase